MKLVHHPLELNLNIAMLTKNSIMSRNFSTCQDRIETFRKIDLDNSLRIKHISVCAACGESVNFAFTI